MMAMEGNGGKVRYRMKKIKDEKVRYFLPNLFVLLILLIYGPFLQLSYKFLIILLLIHLPILHIHFSCPSPERISLGTGASCTFSIE